MLLLLMYHQIINPEESHAFNITQFKNHLIYLKKKFNFVIPGQAGVKNKINLCLTFDDAYADFYLYIFPLLKELNIPAILAIPVNFIQDSTKLEPDTRLSVKYPKGLDPELSNKTPLCTWNEIREMTATNLVYPASHTYMHYNLTKIEFSEAFQEICLSKRIIWMKLEKITEILIYPYGAQNKSIHIMAKNHYQYLMRIGGALNKNWQQNMLYRIDATQFWQNNKKISILHIILWYIKYLINKIRGK